MGRFIEFPPVDLKVEGLGEVEIPPLIPVRQLYNSRHITDLRTRMTEEMKALRLTSLEDKRICITAGSRGIPSMPVIYRAAVDYLKSLGARPFLVPAMGSHGGATAEGQREMLAQYGITEETMDCPILSSMEVVEYAQLENGTPLYCDRNAAEADGILLLHKVRPHTDYRGAHESGLCKMIAIGISKHRGATAFHRLGFEHFAQWVPECAKIFLKQFNVIGGIGIVQNAYDQVSNIRASGPDGIITLDAALLEEAKVQLPRFKFKDLDLLIIDRIGKELSGFGADPNVTGRTNGIREDFLDVLHVNKIFIADLTETTHHNGAGIAQADVTTRRCLSGIDWAATWTNLITSGQIRGAAIPLYMENDRDAIHLAIQCCTGADLQHLRVARIHTTLDIFNIRVSPALYEEIREARDIEKLGEAVPIAFDEEGFLISDW